MKLRLDSRSGVPIYRQIVDQIAHAIAAGRLRADDRLPSVRQLARDLPANQNTVLKAYEHLERDGLISRRHGDGTFVSADGSPLKLAERRRAVREALAAAIVLAKNMNLTAVEVRAALNEQIVELQLPEDVP